MARVLLLLSRPLCMAPRPQKEARALAEAGHDVTVMAYAFTEASIRTDNELMRGAPFRLEYVRNLASREPLERLACLRARVARKVATRRRTLGMLGYDIGAAARFVRRHKPDLVIAHSEAFLPLLPGFKRDGIAVGIDFEDWFSEDLPPNKRAMLPLKELRDLEHWAMRECDYRLATSQAMADELVRASQAESSPAIVYNVFPIEAEWCPPGDDAGQPLKIVWFSQTVGLDRGLQFFMRGLSRAKISAKLTIVGKCAPDVRIALAAKELVGQDMTITFEEPVPPNQLHALLCDHDIGLCLEDPKIPNKDVTVSNKMFQYMMAGLAVVATNTKGQVEVMAAARGAGAVVPFGDDQAVCEAIKLWSADRALLAEARHAARRAALDTWNWEHMRDRVVEQAARALAGKN